MSDQPTTPQPQPTQPQPQPTQPTQPKQTAKQRAKQERESQPERDFDFDVDEEAGTVATRPGAVGWPEGAENEEGIGPDGRKLDERGNPQ
jgi:hypothetical protein